MDRRDDARHIWLTWAKRVGLFLLAAALFYSAITLLRQTTHVFQPTFAEYLTVAIGTDLGALGAGWLGAYLILNGSVIAAIGLALYEAVILDSSGLTLFLFGSRLGAAGIVVVIGVLDYLRRRRLHPTESTALGVISFVVTLLVTLPATLATWAWVEFGGPGVPIASPHPHPRDHHPVEAFFATVVEMVGPVFSLVAAAALMLVSLEVFDRLVGQFDEEALRERIRWVIRSRWYAFGVGLVLTTFTTSVAFSLGAIVPLYNRGYVRRDDMIPYVMGANIGTFGDTVVVALLLDRPGGLSLTLLVLAVIFAFTVLMLVAYRPFERLATRSVELATTSNRALIVFFAGLALVPLSILGLGLLL